MYTNNQTSNYMEIQTMYNNRYKTCMCVKFKFEPPKLIFNNKKIFKKLKI